MAIAGVSPKPIALATARAMGVGFIAQWRAADGHYPAEAHQAAMAAGLVLQLIALGVFFTPERRPRQVPMALAVARALGLDPSAEEIMSPRYRAALSAWRQHVVGTRRQAMAWRAAAVASMTLCIGLAGALSLVLIRPAMALHVVQVSPSTRMSSDSPPMAFRRKATDRMKGFHSGPPPPMSCTGWRRHSRSAARPRNSSG